MPPQYTQSQGQSHGRKIGTFLQIKGGNGPDKGAQSGRLCPPRPARRPGQPFRGAELVRAPHLMKSSDVVDSEAAESGVCRAEDSD